MHGAPLSVALVASALGRHLHHHLAGPKVDYATLALAAAVSWVGIPGAGEAALIAAGISAAHGHVGVHRAGPVAEASVLFCCRLMTAGQDASEHDRRDAGPASCPAVVL